MKFFIVLFILFSFSVYCQEQASDNSTVDTENPDNFKSPLIQKIVAIPVQESDPKKLLSWDKSLFQIGLGQSYFRNNFFSSNGQGVSTFSDGGSDLNLRAQYYLFSFFSLLIDYEFTRFEVERFDGKQLDQKQRNARSFGYGIQFDLGDFILGALINQWNKPFYNLDSSNFVENEYEASVYSYKLGHRTGIHNVIIELFYYYHDLNPFNLELIGDVSGRIQTLGLELFFNTKKTFGLHFAESFGELDTPLGQLEIKQLKVQPFFRF